MAYINPTLPNNITTIASATDPSGGQGPTIQSSISNGISAVPNSMVFPKGLANQDFWMSFSFYEYQRPTFAGNPVLADKETIRLPLPNGMIERQGVSYSEKGLDALTGAAMNQASGGRTSAESVLNSPVATAANIAKAGAAGAAVGGLNNLVNSLGGNNGAALGQLAGVALNPWLNVMFESPQFRTHNLSWTLTPSNETESRTIAQIITTFKYNMLPDSSGALGGSLLTYPNIVQVSVAKAAGEFWNYIFKPAVIKSFTVNYAPQGQPSMFNRTNAPTAVQISLDLQEIEFFLQRDYGSPSSSSGAINLLNKLGL